MWFKRRIKVYCEDCEHYEFVVGDSVMPATFRCYMTHTEIGVDRECPLHPRREYTYTQQWVDAYNKNRGNKCKDYVEMT